MLVTIMIEGFATGEGSARFRSRFPGLDRAGHFRQLPAEPQLSISSIGLGTYLGEPDDAMDANYQTAVRAALETGINLLDTAINYRHQRSERNIGSALRDLVAARLVQRDEVVVCTKAGYLAFDGTVPLETGEYFAREYIDRGIVQRGELAGMHCIAPDYLEDQVERSRRNLRLETIDVLYLHNPESQLCEVPLDALYARLGAAFQRLERLVSEQRIRFYGIASWSAFRVPQGERAFIGIAECVRLAREAGGAAHHFRFLQLPFNLAMTEAHAAAFQPLEHRMLPALEVARRQGLAVVGSASLCQGKLVQHLPCQLTEKLGLESDAQRAIQFARSAPGMLCALAGMSNAAHVKENIRTASEPPMPEHEWLRLFNGCK
jgi:aryl-alcohol dehydrogenase-like predicted oxidoreductase